MVVATACLFLDGDRMRDINLEPAHLAGEHFLWELLDTLANAERSGSVKDAPEGARYITISDTLANQYAEMLREYLIPRK